ACHRVLACGIPTKLVAHAVPLAPVWIRITLARTDNSLSIRLREQHVRVGFFAAVDALAFGALLVHRDAAHGGLRFILDLLLGHFVRLEEAADEPAVLF